jgi:beta-lactamase regulating signal transducer with metallopeptidase domain
VSGFLPIAYAPWVEMIGWILVSSLWQGAAVASALAVTLYLLRQAPAQARYLAACIAMALLIALPVVAGGRLELIRSLPTLVQPLPRPAGPELDHPPVADLTETSFIDRLPQFFPAIVGLWIAGASALSLRIVGGWILSRRWVRRGTRPLCTSSIDGLRERLGISRSVALLEAIYVEVPMVVGWLWPAILVPVAALSSLTALEMEAILAHDLAHIRRHDYLVNVLQCFVEALVFYHPATWWITRVIRREREHCCDDVAVAVSRDRITYARALATLEGLRSPAFSLSPAADGGNLLGRVCRILEPQEESMKPFRILIGLAVLLAVVPIWLARADDQPIKPKPPALVQLRPGDAAKRPVGHRRIVAFMTLEASPHPCLKDQTLKVINNAEAEKAFRVALYYKGVGKIVSAEYYFSKVLQRWPDSPWAAKAKLERAQAAAVPANHTAVQIFDFEGSGS